ncbi:MAG: response regulator transcription factor [Acidobacteria bacterium]|nr:response regulator transcription factor [Acidobacteriota bacterium]
MPETALCVVIIEDLREAREGLSMQVSGTNGFASIGSYSTMAELLNAICTGASGYLMKSTAPSALLDSSPELARRVIALLRQSRCPEQTSSCRLTPQESELLKLMVEGHHYKTAAKEMAISTNTVSFHLKNIYDKLQVHSKTEAVAKALRERLVV